MRVTLLSVLTLALCGAVAVSTAVADDEKKKEEERFPEKVTLKVWSKSGKNFLNPYEDLPAKKFDDKSGVRFSLKAIAVNTGQPTVGSEITHGADVWVVDKVTKADALSICYVKKKP